MPDPFEEKFEPDSTDEYIKVSDTKRRNTAHRRKRDEHNEVGVCPPLSQEIKDKRELYNNDFVLAHRDLFPDSTGQKPFGAVQQESIRFGQDVFHKGGRLLKLEPRGYAKTTRITNEALLAVLGGVQDYIVIICSNLDKAAEILDSLKTEIYNNEQLFELYPGPIACFRNLEDTPQKSRYQTYNGERTYIFWGSKYLRFPWVPGEPSSGKFIEVRPLSNVKGLHHKIKAGPDAGKIFRPTLYIFDDPQTNDEAHSTTNEVPAIVRKIKRDALKGGSHSRRASAIMAITPVCSGDVAWHFEKNEHSWDIVKYKMLEKRPHNHDWWMNDYATVYLNYDRTKRGDRTRAALEAKKLLEENWDFAHEGAEVTWEHAYGWDEDPQTEVSPVQHAYNIILDDGWEDFEFEYQCNTEYGEYEEGETIHCPVNIIMRKTLPYKRLHAPQDTQKIITHIDINKDILTYATVACLAPLQTYVLDYGTHPKQPGFWSKRNMGVPLRTLYPEIPDYREVLYKAAKDLIEHLSQRQYKRQDGVILYNSIIGIDINYEENYITKSILESPFSSSVLACRGMGPGPDKDLLHERPPAGSRQVVNNTYIKANNRHTLDILHYDANYFKTEVHRAFNLEAGLRGSLVLFGQETEGSEIAPERHKMLAEHCNTEKPERQVGKQTGRTRIIWEEKMHQPDNEFFDNLVNCLAIAIHSGIEQELDPITKEHKQEDMSDFMNQQRSRRLL